MAHLSQAELKKIGVEAATEVYGPGVAKEVEVAPSADWAGDPADYFTFLVDEDPGSRDAVSRRTRVHEKIRDELMARNDTTYPYISVLSAQDWDKRERAFSG